MEEKIKGFIHPENSNLTSEENFRLKNRSNHKNIIHQALFNSIDEFAKQVIKDIHNEFASVLFKDNQLNIIADESTLEEIIIEKLNEQGTNVTSLNNPEMIYKAYNFVKPSNLLPKYNKKIDLLKQVGTSESGKEKNYAINPYFFGFKISLDIYINVLFCNGSGKNLEMGLLKILTDKYGDVYSEIYNYVADEATKFAQEGKRKGDNEDETLIEGLKTISGIYNDKVLKNFVYESAILKALQHAEVLGDKV